MEYRRVEAERMLGITSPTFYKRVNKVGIQLIARSDSGGKSTYIREEDLKKLSETFGKPIPELGTGNSPYSEPGKSNYHKAEESEQLSTVIQENFALQLQVKVKEEELKASQQLIAAYREERASMYTQRSQERERLQGQWSQERERLHEQWNQKEEEWSSLNKNYLKTSNRATAFMIASIALILVLMIFTALVVLKKIQF